jgi:hypothetical protein
LIRQKNPKAFTVGQALKTSLEYSAAKRKSKKIPSFHSGSRPRLIYIYDFVVLFTIRHS